MNKKGFTLLELVVAIGIMLIIGGVVTPMLLAHLKDAKTASFNEAILNVKTAFNSWYTAEQGNIADSDGDGDYMDDMVDAGWLSAIPETGQLTWKIVTHAGSSGTEYLINATGATAADFSDTMSDLDTKVDDGNVNDGILKSNSSGFVYLLYDTNAATGFEATP